MANAFFDKWTGSRKPWVNPNTPAAVPVPGVVAGGGGPSLPGGPLTGQPPQAGMGPFGSVPQVPNPLDTARESIFGNLANLPGIHQLLNDIDPTIGARRGIIGDKLGGEVPADVEYLLAQRAAERGIGGGSVNADYLKALGLTSLGIQNEGMGQAGALAKQVFDIESPNFVTPEQQQMAQYFANLMAAAPNPAEAAAYALALQRMGMRAGRVPQDGGDGGADWTSGAYAAGGGKGFAPSTIIRGPASPPSKPQPTTSQGWGFTPGPGYGGEEFDVPFDVGTPPPTGASYPWTDPWASEISGLPTTPNIPDYVTERTGSQFDYGAGDDYGTGWQNFPGFEWMNKIVPTPVASGPYGGEEFEWDF